MKNALLIFIALFLASCGASNRQLNKGISESNYTALNEGENNVSANVKTERESSVFKNFNDKSFKIISTGETYEFRYGDAYFKGNASIEISDRNTETKTYHKTKTDIVYKSHTTYKTKTIYKTVTKYKNVSVQRAGDVYWWVLVGVLLCVGVQVLWKYIKSKFSFKII